MINWEEHYVGTEIDLRTHSFLTWESLKSVHRNKVGLKGPMATPIGKVHRSLNLTLSKELNLYANVRPCYSLPVTTLVTTTFISSPLRKTPKENIVASNVSFFVLFSSDSGYSSRSFLFIYVVLVLLLLGYQCCC